jgi:hypothetical protein
MQSTLGLLLPISKEFMLTIPSIIDNPYVQVDVRVVILYYGALHHGMLLSTGLSIPEKNEYSLFFYRKTLQHMEEWLLQDNVNELSLHVAFWMVSLVNLSSILPKSVAFVRTYTKERHLEGTDSRSLLSTRL